MALAPLARKALAELIGTALLVAGVVGAALAVAGVIALYPSIRDVADDVLVPSDQNEAA